MQVKNQLDFTRAKRRIVYLSVGAHPAIWIVESSNMVKDTRLPSC